MGRCSKFRLNSQIRLYGEAEILERPLGSHPQIYRFSSNVPFLELDYPLKPV
jgi:hypothetical protein